jgi:hypothetical protein
MKVANRYKIKKIIDTTNFDFSLNLKNEDFNDLTTQNKINMIALSFECFSKLNK